MSLNNMVIDIFSSIDLTQVVSAHVGENGLTQLKLTIETQQSCLNQREETFLNLGSFS